MFNTNWIYVILTCLLELIWVLGFNVAHEPWHWIIIISILIMDFYFLTRACEFLPTGTVYAMFAAAGTAGTALMDIFIFGTDFTLMKFIFIALLVFGVVNLKLSDNVALKEV